MVGGTHWDTGKMWIGGGGSIENAYNVEGNTIEGNAILTGTGGNQSFDNRPLYTVVQYIIYIQN